MKARSEILRPEPLLGRWEWYRGGASRKGWNATIAVAPYGPWGAGRVVVQLRLGPSGKGWRMRLAHPEGSVRLVLRDTRTEAIRDGERVLRALWRTLGEAIDGDVPPNCEQ